jgi:phytoene/squalene synthetase
MRVDLKKQVYINENELNQYIYGSADVVGLMCLMVFVGGDEKAFEKLKGPAMKLGSAFQKVNFLRDLKDDVEQLDRQYFPQFDINTFNEKVKLDLIADIENDFKEAREGMVKLPGKSKLAVYIAYVYYKKLLLNIKRTPAKKIMKQRIRVPNPTKIILLGNAYIRYQLNII